MKTVCVIGGGAAGLMAAYAAGEKGNRVILIEKNEKLRLCKEAFCLLLEIIIIFIYKKKGKI